MGCLWHSIWAISVGKKQNRQNNERITLDCAQSPIFPWDRQDIARLTINCGHLDFQMYLGAGVGHYSSTWLLGEGGEKNFSIFLASSQTAPSPFRPLSSFDTHAGLQPVTQSARSRRSYGKIGDCEQSKITEKVLRVLPPMGPLIWLLTGGDGSFLADLKACLICDSGCITQKGLISNVYVTAQFNWNQINRNWPNRLLSIYIEIRWKQDDVQRTQGLRGVK